MSQTVIVLEEDCILASWGKEGKHPSILRAKEQRLRGRETYLNGGKRDWRNWDRSGARGL